MIDGLFFAYIYKTLYEIRLFKYGFFGTNSLVKRLKKYNCPYYVRRYKGLSHEVCHYGSKTALETEYFVQRYIIEKRHLIIDETYKNTDIDPKIEHYDQLRYEFTHNR